MISKKLRDADGQVIARVKRRADLPQFLAIPGAFAILRALAALSEQRSRNTYALNEIDRQQRAIDEARARLLDERKNNTARTMKLLEEAAKFVETLRGATSEEHGQHTD